jgi:hypothetical protein
VGDYRNILGFRTILHTSDQQATPLHEHPLTVEATFLEYVHDEDDDICKYVEKVPDPANPVKNWYNAVGGISNKAPPLLREEAAALVTPDAVCSFEWSDRIQSSGAKYGEDVVSIPTARGEVPTWCGLAPSPVRLASLGHTLPKGPTTTLPSGAQVTAFTPEMLHGFLMPNHMYYDTVPLSRMFLGGNDLAVEIPGAFFHLDTTGSSCFSVEEARQASQHLIDIKFLERVQSRITQTPFLLPQQELDGEAHYCNENVYGK